jgi:hypothetical protein
VEQALWDMKGISETILKVFMIISSAVFLKRGWSTLALD